MLMGECKMIFEPSVEELTKKVGNTYEVANLLAKRARQIMENPSEEIENGDKKVIQVAAEEIASGKVVLDGENKNADSDI